MKKELIHKLGRVKLFLFDLEGVLLHKADSLSEEAYNEFLTQVDNASKIFNELNLGMGIVTARKRDKIIEDLERIEKCIVLAASIEKVKAVEELLNESKIEFQDIFYMGDEVLDIPLLKKCGLSAAPKSAIRDVKRVVNFTIDGKGINSLFGELFALINKAN
jgi:3-deoxy-D-manno-octulosonate 8-phosphate phosphatase (KDO 8-P phosphatase)